ncbi:MAG: aminopeptidase [Candidatus Thermoplasmatota archaeon]|nr:aminopeptidase [Candidatus Thermoplasmatota archaeon]
MGTLAQRLAEQVVNKTLALREGEEYFIFTWQHTIPFADALYVEAAKVGAHPHVELFTDEVYRRYLNEVPEKFIRRSSPMMLKAYDSLDAMTYLGGPEDPAIFDEMPPEKMSAMGEADKPFSDKSLERKIRGVGIDVGQVTPQRAEKYGIDFEDWSASVGEALKSDLHEISKRGNDLVQRLENATEARVTAKNGTDVRFELGGRKALLADGIVDAQDIKKGSLFANLPAGEVSIAPRETTANGLVVFDRLALWGKVLTNVQWEFQDGRIQSYTVGANQDTWDRFYGSATGDKDRIASLSIGLNPRGRPLDLNLTDSFLAGSVGIGIGGNDSLGGANESTFEWSGNILGATVELDGTEIVANGKLV